RLLRYADRNTPRLPPAERVEGCLESGDREVVPDAALLVADGDADALAGANGYGRVRRARIGLQIKRHIPRDEADLARLRRGDDRNHRRGRRAEQHGEGDEPHDRYLPTQNAHPTSIPVTYITATPAVSPPS